MTYTYELYGQLTWFKNWMITWYQVLAKDSSIDHTEISRCCDPCCSIKIHRTAVMFPTVIQRGVREYHLSWVIHTIIHRSDFNKVHRIEEIKELQQSYITAISLLVGGKQEQVMLWQFFLSNIQNPLRLIAILILLFTFIITFYEDGQFVKTVVPLRICK